MLYLFLSFLFCLTNIFWIALASRIYYCCGIIRFVEYYHIIPLCECVLHTVCGAHNEFQQKNKLLRYGMLLLLKKLLIGGRFCMLKKKRNRK